MLTVDDICCSTLTARCRLYKFLSAVLRYPDAQLAEALSDAHNWDNLVASADALAAPCDPPLPARIAAVQSLARGKPLAELEEIHMRVFGASPRGSVAPYECEYGNKEVFQLSGELADIGAFYNAFGVQREGGAGERIDHIAVECEFMALLCVRELTALLEEHGAIQAAHLDMLHDAQRKFLREHIGHWGVAFAHQLIATDSAGLYGAVGALLEALLIHDAESLKVPRGAAFVPLREVLPADDPSNCISCAKEEGLPGTVPMADEE